ncbi:ATP-binding protein [Schleiferiaceae bacterium]|nr:ATP-binding protein [Schleiferiaceae bacterium]
MQMQDQLIKAANRMGEAAEINITKANLAHYRDITRSQRIRDSIALLKRFVAIQGREGVQDKAKRLITAMERMVKNDKVSKDDPYSARLNDAYKSLKLYIREKKKTPEIQSGELNGIYGLLGMTPSSVSHTSPRKSKGLGSVMSSADLVRMDFDTIGLKGKFRELMGDPSVGFTAMVFGQPKSGKSTLMLEFAHHLAVHHGDVLYVAIEEGYGYTLKEKIARIGAVHARLNFSEALPKDVSTYDYVFIDSVSRAGMELEDLVKLKNRYPRTSFVFIFHATKDGKFRGGNELAHEVDVIIEVENKIATASGRFNAGGQLKM